jgi:hypothetical protein
VFKAHSLQRTQGPRLRRTLGGHRVTDSNVTRVFSLDEALAFILERGKVHMTVPELASTWSWPHRTQVYRALDRWVREGLIERGGNVIRARVGGGARPSLPAVTEEQPAVTLVPDQLVGERPSSPEIALSHNDVTGLSQPVLHPRKWDVTAVILGVTALALAVIGMVVNARQAASLGMTPDASGLLAAEGLCADLLVLVLPTVATRLWVNRQWMGATTAWAIWVGVIGFTLLATATWSATNVGDAVAGRVAIAERAEGLAERLHRLRDERKTIAEAGPVPAIDAALVAAQGSAGRVWGWTNGCREIDRGEMSACRRTIELREARAGAERRDQVDREIADLDTRIAAAPSIRDGDPGAAMVTETLPWLTQGAVHPTEREVQRPRVLGLTLLPAFAGLLLGTATQAGRQRGVTTPRCTM